MPEPRLGDDIDDFCVRCKRVMNHTIVSVVDGAPAKVRCRTCHSDHDFRHEQAPPPKVDLRKQALFAEVLKKVSPGDAVAAAEVDPEVGTEIDPEVSLEAAAGGVIEPDGVAIAEPEVAPVEPAPKPKKAKG